MSRRIAVIDYGAGNLTSVRKGCAAAGAETFTPATPAELCHAGGMIVPGVGHFSATAALVDSWRLEILRRVETGVPLLGICLGMQWLFDGSAEAPNVAGLGLIQGTCTRIEAARPLKVPHVGWNTLSSCADGSSLLRGVPYGTHMYFTHTYAAPVTAECVATTVHGETFAAVVERGHVMGVQFHPEKSSLAGLQILRNFVRMVNS